MTTYAHAIREGFAHLLSTDDKVFTIGQGLWSPWYVGDSMAQLEVDYGVERVIDTPVSEAACTGAALGAAISGYRPIVIHPRVDFAILALDQIVNQAAKWNHMFGGDAPAPLVVRAIINRGGEQGAQHSQSLASWFAHIPGLRVVMPSTAKDARDLLVAATQCDDPVIYLDDRWLYELDEDLGPVDETPLAEQGARRTREGSDVTLVGYSYTAHQCRQAAEKLAERGIQSDVVDLRVLNPLEMDTVLESVAKTKRLLVVDGDWGACGIASEVIARCAEEGVLGSAARLCLPPAPAPTSGALESAYYSDVDDVVGRAQGLLGH
ncbi:MAG: transketolase C-terminal domain-containing protein [Candidatus Binatia bacterium]|nr:transketolase C-terminal domain-containing protein [Candidatus Binatia bacterium]